MTHDAVHSLEALILLYYSNNRLLGLLNRVKRDTDRARAYLDQPGCDRTRGLARLRDVRGRRRKVLRRLEANWLAIRELVDLPVKE